MKFKKQKNFYLLNEIDYELKELLEHYIDWFVNFNKGKKLSSDLFLKYDLNIEYFDFMKKAQNKKENALFTYSYQKFSYSQHDSFLVKLFELTLTHSSFYHSLDELDAEHGNFGEFELELHFVYDVDGLKIKFFNDSFDYFKTHQFFLFENNSNHFNEALYNLIINKELDLLAFIKTIRKIEMNVYKKYYLKLKKLDEL